jgi:integrase
MNKPKTISKGDADRIRDGLSFQDQLIFDFSIETGLRISDILKLRRCNIAKAMEIRESKTMKYKIVEISDELLSKLPKGFALGRYPYAFNSPRTLYKPLHRSTYHRHLKKVAEELHVEFSAHSARKLYAQNVFRETRNIFAVQKALNHKYITTTCKYLDIDLIKLIEEVKPT